ncbi:TolC family protein [Sphingobacterium sp. HMA12]|uniref:TolC family protein n=1 Tax=Sphingobacterium sp. HMA12 TaxID=2050894 RepID=UPI0013152103|nr:TolC family protein [Sphingobacterium sp. HMA12]
MNFFSPYWAKAISTIAVLSCSVLETQAQDSLRISLADLISKSLQNSKYIEQSHLLLQEKGIALQQQRMELLPKISVRAAVSYASNMPVYDRGIFAKPSQHDVIHYLYDTGLDFYLNLYNGHRDLMKIESKKLELELANIDWKSATAAIKLEISNLFLDLDLAYRNRSLIEQDIEDQRTQLKEIEHRYTAGVVLHSDVLRISLELSKRELLLVQITNDIRAINQKLQLITDIRQEIVPMCIPMESHPLNYAELAAIARKQAFVLLKSEQEVALKKLGIKHAKSNYLPELGLTNTFTFANPQVFLYPYNASWYNLNIVGLKLNIPISALYLNKNIVRGAQIALKREEVRHHHEEEEVENELLQAYLDYNLALEQRAVCQKNLALAKENARIIKNRYFKSSALITDLLDADMQCLKTNFDLESARIALQKHYYFIEFLKGTI